MHLGILSLPLCKFVLKEVIPAFLDTGESWSSTSWCSWLVMWVEKYVTVGKEEGRLWYLLPREKQQLLSQAVYSSRRCCQLNNTSLQGHEVLLSQAWTAWALPGQALSADCSTLSPRAPCFSSRRVKVSHSAHSPLPTTQPPVFTCVCCLSFSLLCLLSGNIFLFLPRVTLSHMTLTLPPLAEQKEKGPLWYGKLWCSGEDPLCSEMAAESMSKLGRAELAY